MNDMELDEFLKKGKTESDRFFSQVQVASLRKALIHKISHPEHNKQFQPKFRLIGAGIAAACVILAISVYFVFNSGIRQPVVEQTVLSEQTVPINVGNDKYMVSFNPVFQPKESEPGLMSILWKYNNSDKPNMVYNSLFEKSDQPYPISVVGFPGDSASKILLISSGSSKKSYIHYRLVELYQDNLETLWSQDFVPQGKLGVQNGVVVEQRLPDLGMQIQISYFIPYKTDRNGTVLLPMEVLNLQVGDKVIFIGEDGRQIQADSQNSKLTKTNATLENQKQQVAIFQADAAGEDAVLLGYGKGHQKTLVVKITK